MRDWNVLVTVAPGRGENPASCAPPAALGSFERTEFKNVFSAMSRIGPSSWKRFRLAEKTTSRGLADLARAIPVEQIFSFTPESLTEQMKEATAPFVGRMSDGTFHVRLERRGLPGQVMSRRWNAVLGNTCWNCRNSR